MRRLMDVLSPRGEKVEVVLRRAPQKSRTETLQPARAESSTEVQEDHVQEPNLRG